MVHGRNRRTGGGPAKAAAKNKRPNSPTCWLATLANVGIDLSQAVRDKYGAGCPGCGQMVCRCDLSTKP
jgi:hypothetical protein